MEYTKDNYLYGTGSGDTWHVNIDPPKRKVKTYFEETVEAVEYVYANKTGKFTVMLSGGLDSRYVCEVLLKLGLEFDVVIIELKDNKGQNYNEHDFKYAYEFCKNKNIIPKTFILNFDKFVDSGRIVEIAESVSCCSPVVSTCLHVIEQLDGFILLGNDPPYLRLEKDKNVWMLEELQYIHGLLRYFQKHNLPGCPFLLSFTPEMMLSFLLDPHILKLGTGQHPGKLGSNSTKSYVFNNGSGFNMPIYDFTNKTRIKLNGFEFIYKSPIRYHPNLSIFYDNFFKIWNGEYLEPYTEVIERLSINQYD
jgi:hypothetical protein